MLAFTTRGDGKQTVLMLHGFLGSGRNLGSLARLLSLRDPQLSFVLPDLTGHGTSPPLPPNADLSTLAVDVFALGRSLNIQEPMTIIGHSLGGRVALKMRAIDAAAVDKVILLDASPSRIDARPSELSELGRRGLSGLGVVLDALLAAPDFAPTREELGAALMNEGLSQNESEWLLMNLVRVEDTYRWRFDRKALAQLFHQTRLEDLWPMVEADGARTKLIRGSLSDYVSEDDAARFKEAGSQQLVIEGAGHVLHADRPEQVADAILALDGGVNDDKR